MPSLTPLRPLLPGLLVAITAALPGSAVLAQLRDPPLPTRDSLRQLQILIFTCSRENQAGACDQARQIADPLLDHPRLSGSCKDRLWEIRQEAVVAQANSFSRRDRLDRLAMDMLRFCQPTPQPAPSTAPARPAQPGQP